MVLLYIAEDDKNVVPLQVRASMLPEVYQSFLPRDKQ